MNIATLYCIGFTLSCVIFLIIFRGVMLNRYLWEKAYWTETYRNKEARTSVYASTLLAASLWPVSIGATIILYASMFVIISFKLFADKFSKTR